MQLSKPRKPAQNPQKNVFALATRFFLEDLFFCGFSGSVANFVKIRAPGVPGSVVLQLSQDSDTTTLSDIALAE